MQSSDSMDWVDFWGQAKSFTPPLSSGKLVSEAEQTVETCQKPPGSLHESDPESSVQQLSQNLTRHTNGEERTFENRELSEQEDNSEMTVEKQEEYEKESSSQGIHKTGDPVSKLQEELFENRDSAYGNRDRDIVSEESVCCEQGDIQMHLKHSLDGWPRSTQKGSY